MYDDLLVTYGYLWSFPIASIFGSDKFGCVNWLHPSLCCSEKPASLATAGCVFLTIASEGLSLVGGLDHFLFFHILGMS